MLGMMGFRITINYHGEVTGISQPSVPAPLAVEVPFPPWATASSEVASPERAQDAISRFG